MFDLSADTRASVMQANGTSMSAFARHDARAVANLYSEDAKLLPPESPIIEGRGNIAAFWDAVMKTGIERAELHTLELDCYADVAIEVGRARLFTRTGEVVSEPKYIVVWKPENGQWKLHEDIWNSTSQST